MTVESQWEPEEVSDSPMGFAEVYRWTAHQGPYISGSQRWLLAEIGAHVYTLADGRSGPTEAELARTLRCNPRTIIRNVQVLVASGHLTIEQVPAGNGFQRNVYTLTGAVNGWAITKSSDKPDPSEIYQLRAEVFALTEKLATYENGIENIKEDYVTEKMSHGSSSSNYVTKKMSPSLTTTTTTDQVTEKVTRSSLEIQLALESRWETLGKGWKGGFPVALNFFTRQGRCVKPCNACGLYPNSFDPHQDDFWRQWELAGGITPKTAEQLTKENRDKYIGEFERRRGILPAKVDG